MGTSPSANAGRRWSITYHARPITLNASYGHHRYERTQHVIEWRETFRLLVMEAKVPRLDAITVTVETGMSGRIQDIGNCYVSAKAAIDGLVKGKIIPDDTGAHLKLLSFLPPIRIPPKEQDYMTLHIEEVADA